MARDFSVCRLAPFAHQREDAEWLADGRRYALIASEMRTGKTKVVIDAGQFLFGDGEIDLVLVVAPAPVRDVWYDPRLGELQKHLWDATPATVVEYHSRIRTWLRGPAAPPDKRLRWWVTNYEFLRKDEGLQPLLSSVSRRTMLVLDESSLVKGHDSQQTKACAALRRRCGRVVLLNGTPIHHSPLDLFSQGNLLHPSILDCRFVTHFKARYAIQQAVLGHGGKPLTKTIAVGTRFQREITIQEISGWTNLEDLERRFAPHTRRRLQADCPDMPPKLDPVTLTAELTPATWRHYKTMRQELVAWLSDDRVATASTAAIKSVRLAQITSGFLGGVEDVIPGVTAPEEGLLESLDLGGGHEREPLPAAGPEPDCPTGAIEPEPKALVEIGREKLDVLLWFLGERLAEDPGAKVVVWTRFRAELFRMLDAVRERFPAMRVEAIHGAQRRADRLRALALMKPETAPAGAALLGGVIGSGSFGLDMRAARIAVTMSETYSPGQMAQTFDRIHGPVAPGTAPTALFEIVAVGPRGQRTIDHDVLGARLSGEDVARRTTAAWVTAISAE